MKKFLIGLATLLTMSFSASAQSSLLATLSHEGNITSYYGTNALKEAVAASVNGDVITLSSGQFNAVDINKAITVRGAGIVVDSITGSQPTVLTGNFSLSAPTESTDAKLILEGLYHNHTVTYNSNIQNAQIIKCRFNKFDSASGGASNVSMSIIQCRINSSLYLSPNSSMTCINSYIYNPSNGNNESYFEMQNCVVYYGNHIYNSIFGNCIFFPPTSVSISYLASNNMAYNCIIAGSTRFSADDFFKYIPNSTNKVLQGYDIFKTFEGGFNDGADFILTDDAAKTYLGTDGTQVGLYGGMMPYNTTPNNPQITKFNVASKSTADGKLSVDIQVGVPE